MKRVFDLSRRYGPRVIAGMLVDAAASGAGTFTGPVLEAVASLGADPLLSPSAALAGPTVQGVRVVPTMTTTHEAQNARVTASRLTPEMCLSLDPGLLEAMEMARSEDPQRALDRVSIFHVVDVSANDPGEWHFVTGGDPTPPDTPSDMKVSGIPIPCMREHALEAYMQAKVWGVPHYLHVERTYGSDGPFAYRCLIDPVFNSAGMVCRLNVLVLVEKPSHEFVSRPVGQVKIGRSVG